MAARPAGGVNVRHVLRELHRLGVADEAIGIEDEGGDRYGRAEWIKDLPVARIVIIPEWEPAPVTPEPRTALNPATGWTHEVLDDDDDIQPYVGEFS